MDKNAFLKPVYITRPLMPRKSDFSYYVDKLWTSKMLSNNGIYLQELEKKLKKVLQVSNLLNFNNGTIALLIGIKALELKGEVITTPFTFPATVDCLIWNNLKPVFCDIEEDSMNIDANKIEKLITPKTSAILAVHVFGSPCNVDKISKIAKKHNLKVIYDGAHAFETKVNGKSIGRFGDLTMFSFHPTKLFHTSEGGCLVFKDKKLGEKISLNRNFGIKSEDEVVLAGINGKMNEFQAAMGLAVLKKLKEERKKRKKLKSIYKLLLEKIEGISFPKTKNETRSSLQYLAIRIDKEKFGVSRDEVYLKLKNYNVFARKYFYPLVSDYPFIENKNSLPIAKKVVSEVLCLPFFGEMGESTVRKICKFIISFGKK